MPAPGMPPGGMGGMSPPSGEVSEQLAQMMGGASGTQGGKASSAGGVGGSAAQAAQLQQLMGQGGLPSPDANGVGGGPTSGVGGVNPAQKPVEPRPVGTIAEEFKTGISDIFQGIKEFFSINKWLGVNPETLDPQQQAHAKQLHSRYQQLDQEQQMVARQLFEEKMQKKKIAQEEEARKKEIEAQQKAQSIEVPSGPKKGAEGPGGGKSKKQNVMTKLKQDRTTLNNTQGE